MATQDWFSQNAPKQQAQSDWFSDNAPAQSQYQQDVANRPGVPGVTIPAGLQSSAPQAVAPAPSSTAGNVAVGAAKGLLNTVTSLPAAAGAKINDLFGYSQPQSVTGRSALYAPSNTAQAVGRGIEQAAEFLAPAGAEEKAATWFTGKAAPIVAKVVPKAAEWLVPASKVATQAISSGAVNKAQGGSFSAGAAGGALASGIGQGLQRLAPVVAEGALGIKGADRALGRTPGQAILDETTGFKPSTIADQAQQKLDTYTGQVDNLLRNAPDVSLAPARQIANDAVFTATQRNNPETIKRTGAIAKQLTTNYGTDAKPVMQDLFGTTQRDTGLVDGFGKSITSPVSSKVGQVEQQLPEIVPASKARQLRQGVSDLKGSWNPATQNDLADSTVGQVYNSLNDQLEQAAPGTRALNQKISSLIPVAKRATATDLGPGSLQKILNHSPITGTVIGGFEGGREGGVGGALKGAATGALTGAVLRSPAGRMALARMLYGPGAGIVRAGNGGALQLAGRKKPAQ